MLIGISGKIGSGKDTLAELIIKNDPSFVQKRFADKLKEIVMILGGVSHEDAYSQEGKNKFVKEFGMTIGQMQQTLGTEVFGAWDEETWIKALFSGYGSDQGSRKPNWVISDVRFKNEADRIKLHGGILIRLNGDPAKVRENSNRDLNHASETSLDEYPHFDYVYNNDISLNALESFAKHVLERNF